MRSEPIPAPFYVENRKRLAARLKPGAIAILHSADIMPQSADGNMAFYQNSDFHYLTGVDQEESVLVLWPDAPDEADREILFVRETNEMILVWEGEKLTKEAATERAGIQNVQWTDRFEFEFRRLMKKTGTVYLNSNEHARAAKAVQTRDDRFRARCQELYPSHRYERVAPFLYEERIIKREPEIVLTQKACDITGDGFARLLGFVRPGVMEYEVEAELLHEFVRQGSRGFAYNPIIAGGVNACALHYLENNKECKDGDLLLMDVAAEYGRYNSDLTRTIPINGKYTPRQKDVYNAVLRVFRACLDDLLKPGVKIKEYQEEVCKVMEQELLGLGLLDPEKVAEERANDDDEEKKMKLEDRSLRKYFMHGTSHSLGLDVHDVGPAEYELQEGMLFTIEPGIYIREEGFGIRLENDVLIQESGNIDLMAGIPIEADEIEALMQQRQSD